MRKKLSISALAIFLVGMLLVINHATAAKREIPHLAPVVETATAKQIAWQPSLEIIGTLTAYHGTIVSAEASGRVTRLYFKSGQTIKQGQPIIEIFPDMIQATLDENRANLKLNQLDYEREKKLAARNFASQATLDEKAADVAVDQAKVTSTEAQLKQYILTAPFSGKLGLRQVSLGQYLTVGTPIVNLQSINPLRVDFSVPGSYLGLITLGDRVTLTSRAYPGETFEGKIYATDASINTVTRMLGVRASIPNQDGKLLPGAFVNVQLHLRHAQPYVVIPTTAILYSRRGSYVYMLDANNKATQQFITVGEELDHNRSIIIKGLKPGDTFISAGQLKIHPGDPVLTKTQAEAQANQISQSVTNKRHQREHTSTQ